MLTRFECVNSYEAVAAVGSENVNDFDIVHFENVMVIGEDLRVRCTVYFGSLLCFFFDNVAERYHLNVGEFLESGKVLAVCNTAASDYTDFYDSVHADAPYFTMFDCMLVTGEPLHLLCPF